jgi:hypothetical protein
MSSVALLIMPRLQFLDANGKPLAGGKVFTYQAGTTTPQATFVDSAGVIQNANPVILDAGGFGNIWLAAQSYKILVQNSAGVQQWVVDNVQSFNGQIAGTFNVTGTLTSSSANPATAGFIRSATGDLWKIRNNANSLDLTAVSMDASDRVVLGDTTGAKFPAFYDVVGITPAPALSSAGQGRIYFDSAVNRALISENNNPFIYFGGSLLSFQGPSAAVQGTGANVTLYTYTLKGKQLLAGKGIRIRVIWQHTTATAAVSYSISYGGSNIVLISFNDPAATVTDLTLTMFNNVGATGAQTTYVYAAVNGTTLLSAPVVNTTAIDSTVDQSLNFVFNAANTEFVTPKGFFVELMN